MQERPVEAVPAANQDGHSASEDHSEASVQGHVDATEPLRTAALRAAFATLRPSVMRSVPHFFIGPFRNATLCDWHWRKQFRRRSSVKRLEIDAVTPTHFAAPSTTGRFDCQGQVAPEVPIIARGEWLMLLEASGRCAEETAIARRRRRHLGDDVQKRAARAELKVALGELSSARQALEGEETQQLADESKRPPRLMDPVPPDIMHHTPLVPFALDTDKFLKNLRSAKRGAAPGPSGMTVEHLRPLLDSVTDQQWMCKLAEQVAQGRITPTVIEAIRMERMTALRKANGGVRGIVVGDVVRRLVAHTMPQQLGPHALSIRAGSECVAHVIHGLSS